MKLRYNITSTGVVQAVPDSCTPGEEYWTPLFILTDKQLRALDNYRSLAEKVAESVKKFGEVQI